MIAIHHPDINTDLQCRCPPLLPEWRLDIRVSEPESDRFFQVLTGQRKPGPNLPVVDLLHFLAAWWEMFRPD